MKPKYSRIMIEEMKNKAKEFIQSDKADELLKKAGGAVSDAAENVGNKLGGAALGLKDKANELLESDKGQELINKAKTAAASGVDKIDELKDKAENFVHDKTNGKGIFGFGKDD